VVTLSRKLRFALAFEEEHHSLSISTSRDVFLRSSSPSTAEHRPVFLPSLRQWQTQLAMDNSGKEKEAMQLMAEADKKVKASGSFLGGMFG